MNSWKCFEMTAPNTFRNNVSERILEKTSVMVCNVLQLHEYFLQPTIMLKAPLQVIFMKSSERKGYPKISKKIFRKLSLFP